VIAVKPLMFMCPLFNDFVS